jgi:uncharacterized protein (TIGR02246 family)
VSDGGPDQDRDQQDEVLPNSAADEFFGRMKHDFRRPKPSDEAVASALQAIQKLTGEVTIEHSPNLPGQSTTGKCHKCGAPNSGMNRFCGYCGALMERPERPQTKPENDQAHSPSESQHYYHHHYHHHYFSEAEKAAGEAPGIRWDRQELASEAEEAEESVPTETAAEAANAIQRLVQTWSVCFNSKRLDDLVELYSSDAIVLRPNSAPAHGKEAVRKLVQTALDTGLGDVELDCADIGIVGDFACLTGRGRMLVPTAPAKRREETGKYLMVARRENGQWKIVADSWCMDLPKAPPASASAPVLPIRAQRK